MSKAKYFTRKSRRSGFIVDIKNHLGKVAHLFSGNFVTTLNKSTVKREINPYVLCVRSVLI